MNCVYVQFLAMGADQRNAIRKALNEDAAKLLEEGDPADPQLRRLRREMDEVNRLFDEFEKRALEEGCKFIINQQGAQFLTFFEKKKSKNSKILQKSGFFIVKRIIL